MSAGWIVRLLGFRWLWCLGVALLLAGLPRPLLAQSAADKATARQLAVEGINLYKQGDYAPALDKLERAQALYAAHVHLVYIARCQVKLGKLVDGAEAYRALARLPLPPDASEVVKNARAEGAEELSKIEPRIPTLRVEVEPKDAKGVELTINGEPVPAAVIGVDRPVNPGKVVVKVGGAGWKPAEASVEVPEAARQSVLLKLEKGPEPEPGAAQNGGGAAGAGTAGAAAPASEAEKTPDFGILLGLRLGMTAPFGQLELSGSGLDSDTTRIGQLLIGGGGGEARLGFRFLRKLTGLVSADGYIFQPRGKGSGTQLDELALRSVSGGTRAVSRPFGYRAGLGLMYTHLNPGLDWFVEGALAYQGFRSDSQVTFGDDTQCTRTIEFSGGVLRATGGVVFPLSRVFSVHPFGSFSLGSFTKGSMSGDCGLPVDLTVKGVQGWVTLGIGGDFVIPVRD